MLGVVQKSLFLVSLSILGGCAGLSPQARPVNRAAVKHRALEILEAGIQYPYNPVVRVEAVEAIASSRSEEGLPWVRISLLDEHPAVRFAACVALGELGDASSIKSIRKLLSDNDANVQAACIYALHRLGDHTHSGKLSTFLLENDNVTVRRNAALLLGRLGEKSAVRILAKAMGDSDQGVRQHALEGMARLENDEACNELAFLSNSGIGSVEVFAIQALAQTRRTDYIEPFRYKLASSDHLEVRLAAALGLELLGQKGGFEFALRSLRGRRPIIKDPKDPDSQQILRGRVMAISVLGASKRSDALPELAKLMDDESDPRVQVAGAQAVLKILNAQQQNALPFD